MYRTKNGTFKKVPWYVEHEMLATTIIMLVFAVVTLSMWYFL